MYLADRGVDSAVSSGEPFVRSGGAKKARGGFGRDDAGVIEHHS